MDTLLSQSPSSADVHFPDSTCSCAVGPVYDFKLRQFRNGTLHIYRFCVTCGATSRSPVKRETISLKKWRELLREVRL